MTKLKIHKNTKFMMAHERTANCCNLVIAQHPREKPPHPFILYMPANISSLTKRNALTAEIRGERVHARGPREINYDRYYASPKRPVSVWPPPPQADHHLVVLSPSLSISVSRMNNLARAHRARSSRGRSIAIPSASSFSS